MLFRSYRKRKALESYHHVLGPRLRATWGRREHYTPDQVAATVATHRLSDTFLCYALALYCDRESFEQYHFARGEECSYVRMWHELTAVSVSDGSMNLSAMRAATHHEQGAMDDAAVLDDVARGSDAGCDIGADTGSCDSGAVFDGGGFDGGGFDGGGGGD